MSGDDIRYVVLLKHGTMWVAECLRAELFTLAREADAGICGSFDSRTNADAFIVRHAHAKSHAAPVAKPFLVWSRVAM